MTGGKLNGRRVSYSYRLYIWCIVDLRSHNTRVVEKKDASPIHPRIDLCASANDSIQYIIIIYTYTALNVLKNCRKLFKNGITVKNPKQTFHF